MGKILNDIRYRFTILRYWRNSDFRLLNNSKGNKMNDLSLYFLKSYRAGENGYYGNRHPGTIDVWSDNKRYVYAKIPKDRKGMKISIIKAFSNNGKNTVKISGRYPSYQVETE